VALFHAELTLALRCLGYNAADPIGNGVCKQLIDLLSKRKTPTGCSPAFRPFGILPGDAIGGFWLGTRPSCPSSGELLSKQILDYGDWAVKNRSQPGGWAFEFENRFIHVDDSAVVVTLQAVQLPNENSSKRRSPVPLLGLPLCSAMQVVAFDINNDQDWLNYSPYSDLKAMIDPNTADVTARVLEMVGRCNPSIDSQSLKHALGYLRREQEDVGCWFGRWG